MERPLRPALFLDRDGVVNVEKNYVHRREDFEFVPGIFELCGAARAAGRLVVVVTNQAGIGRGLYTESDFHAVTTWMHAQFAERGAPVDAVYFCPFHPQHGIGRYKAESFDRKPNPGMLLRARDDHGIDLARSALVGDRLTDIAAATAAGVGVRLLLALPGHPTEPEGDGDASDGYTRVDSLEAARRLLFP